MTQSRPVGSTSRSSGKRTSPTTFYRQIVAELRKVVWPTRQETLQTALVVFIAITAMGIFFWFLDWVLGALTRALTGQGG